MKMHLNYLILAYHKPKQLKLLIKTLLSDNTTFYIHIDNKTDIAEFKSELASFNQNQIIFCTNRVTIAWGDFSIVQATLNLMRLIENKEQKAYTILLSGVDFPLFNNQDIKSFFINNYGNNYLRCVSMYAKMNYSKDPWRVLHYCFHPYMDKRVSLIIPNIFDRQFYKKTTLTHLRALLKSPDRKYCFHILKPKRIPKGLLLFGGGQWFALPQETINYILKYVDNTPEYIQLMRFSHCADEMFFQCIIASNYPLATIRDELTYTNWSRKNCVLPVTFEKTDLPELQIARESFLFARKFDIDKDSKILNFINEENNSK